MLKAATTVEIDPDRRVSRRRFLAGTAALGIAAWPTSTIEADGPAVKAPLKRVAAINSIYRLRSHAYHIAGRFIHGYSREGFHHQPPFQLARMYNDQYPEDDLSRQVSKRHGVELSSSVAEALGGERGLDVDGVLLICEHGDYPVNDLGQILYPRYQLFEQIVDVFRKSGRSVPVFCDKHLSFDHQLAAKMVRTSQEMKFGLMAGSSLPVTWRRPEVELPLETPVLEGLVCYGFDRGVDEIYLFHGLETLQCMLERRKGGETGIRSIVFLEGPAVWKAGDEGRWSWKLLQAAIARSPSANIGDVRENVTNPRAILIEYRDGTKGALLDLPEHLSDFNFAGKIAGRDEPVSTCFYLPNPPGAKYFDALTANIEKLFATGKSPYPVERTLLTSTVLDLALHSRKAQGTPRSDRALEIRYQAPADSGFFRGRYTDAG